MELVLPSLLVPTNRTPTAASGNTLCAAILIVLLPHLLARQSFSSG